MGLGAIVAGVVTGEAVVLDVPCARFPSRLLALGIDLAIQLAVIVILLVIAGLSTADQVMNQAALQAVVLTVIVLTVIGYPVIWETLTRGRSPGKLALGLRVVSDDGGPERFRQALVRGLATIVDFWLLLGVPALISSLLSDKGKRLGDIFAGTFVIQHRLPAPRAASPPPVTPPELAAWATGLELSGLSDQTAAMARQYLSRLPELAPGARAELGERISAAVRAQVGPPPPPGTPAPAYLGAVLAERHRREHARLTAAAAGTSAAGPGWRPPAAPLSPLATQPTPLPASPSPLTAPPSPLTAPPPPLTAPPPPLTAPPPLPAPRWTPPADPLPPPPAESRWAPPGQPQVPPPAWMGAAGETEGPQPGQPQVPPPARMGAAGETEGPQPGQPGQPVEPGEPASPPAAGTGFVPPQ